MILLTWQQRCAWVCVHVPLFSSAAVLARLHSGSSGHGRSGWCGPAWCSCASACIAHRPANESAPDTKAHRTRAARSPLHPNICTQPAPPSVVIAKTRSFLLQRAWASAHARQTLRTETLHAAVTLPATSLAPARLFPPLLLTGLLQSACFPAQEGVSHLECSLLSHLSNKKKSFAHRCLFTLNMSL